MEFDNRNAPYGPGYHDVGRRRYSWLAFAMWVFCILFCATIVFGVVTSYLPWE